MSSARWMRKRSRACLATLRAMPEPQTNNVLRVLTWQAEELVIYTVLPLAVYGASTVWDLHSLELPNLPVSVLGAALGIFVSFRTNSAYGRWWEGRKLLGRLINSSRHLASQLTAYLSPEEAAISVRRHVAWVRVFVARMLHEEPLSRLDGSLLDPGERAALDAEPNANHGLMDTQLAAWTRLADQGTLDGLRLHSLDGTAAALLDILGGCERIRNTPFPRIYELIARSLTVVYGIVMPLALLDDVGWLVVPLTTLACLTFGLINDVGTVLEQPFRERPPLPIDDIGAMVEAEALHRISDAD